MPNFSTWVKTLIASASAFIAGCSPGLLVVNIPPKFSSVNHQKDIVFAPEHDLKLDIYAPAKSKQQALPVLIFFYGGNYQDGRKEQYAFVGTALADQGYLVVVPDYRKYPQVTFPEFVKDGAEAVAWVQRNIADYGGNSDQVRLLGHSAGAHIASLIATDESYLNRYNIKPKEYIKQFVGLAGPYAYKPEEQLYKDIFDLDGDYSPMMTPHFVNGNEPPMLLVHGGKDDLVPVSNLNQLAEALEKKGEKVKTLTYPDLEHADLIACFSILLRRKAPVLEDVLGFLDDGDI